MGGCGFENEQEHIISLYRKKGGKRHQTVDILIKFVVHLMFICIIPP